MGKRDVITKVYMSDNNRFADVFNYFLYGGKKILCAEDLEERDPIELLVNEGERDVYMSDEVHKKERDLLRSAVVRMTDTVCYVLLGLENQSFVDYGMPIRKMLYEAMRYERQRKAFSHNYEEMRKKGDKVQMDSSEFLSGIRKDDKFLPIITLTLYFGQEEWDGPLSLHEMLKVEDENLLSYIADYKVNLLLPREIERFDSFETELKQVLETLKVAHDKQKLKELIEDNEDFENIGRDTALMIKECTGIEFEIDEMEERVNMCKGFADLKKEYIDAGRNEGFCAGQNAAVSEMAKKLLKKGMSPEEIADITELSLAEVHELEEFI